MDKQLLKQLIDASYTKNELDEKKVKEIAEHLSRKELKEYIRALKAQIAKQTIYVETAQALSETDKKAIIEKFPGKKIISNVKPDLLAGLKITNDDIIYELNLQSSLKNISAYLSESI